jgi:Ni2+-binding GTPase involved in maturation of urease and hydrogenase
MSASVTPVSVLTGYLGSGKTTSIAAAARALLARGRRVGIVTNDQGKHLVDTAFFRALQLPSVEVTGGCFCCNYDDLEARLRELEGTARPDVIFAESVGSCADVVATVIRPLLELSVRPASYSVFVDSRLLLQRLRGLPLPFSENIIYVFDMQLEEAGVLVINKSDLLSPDSLRDLQSLAQARWPQKVFCAQNATAADGVTTWLHLIEEVTTPGMEPLDIDYARYGNGEAELAWLDMRLTIELPNHDGRGFIIALWNRLQKELAQAEIAIGHVKLTTTDTIPPVKMSLTTAHGAQEPAEMPPLIAPRLSLILNGRAQTSADPLATLVNSALEATCIEQRAALHVISSEQFHPDIPRPTHRMA